MAGLFPEACLTIGTLDGLALATPRGLALCSVTRSLPCGWVIDPLSAVGGASVYAVLTRSIETVSVRPFFLIFIVLSPRLTTSYGPS